MLKKEVEWVRTPADMLKSEKRFIADAENVLKADSKIDTDKYKKGCTLFKRKFVIK